MKKLEPLFKKDSRGFTLVELLVAMSLFLIVATIAVSNVITTGDLVRVAGAQRAVIDNVNFAIETMSRKIKVGTTYHCDATNGSLTTPRPCDGAGNTSFAFLSSDGQTEVVYRLSSDGKTIETNSCSPAISCNPNSGTFSALTSPDVTIESLKFYSFPAGIPLGDGKQPEVTIFVRGYTEQKGLRYYFVLQTLLSQRVLQN
jgi:prepilin-type N-terminal cleavage/methylation domain-containing protein